MLYRHGAANAKETASQRAEHRPRTSRALLELRRSAYQPPVVVPPPGGGERREHVEVCVPVAIAGTIIPPLLKVPLASKSKVEFIEAPLTVADPVL
jgi:hypothetical protein